MSTPRVIVLAAFVAGLAVLCPFDASWANTQAAQITPIPGGVQLRALAGGSSELALPAVTTAVVPDKAPYVLAQIRGRNWILDEFNRRLWGWANYFGYGIQYSEDRWLSEPEPLDKPKPPPPPPPNKPPPPPPPKPRPPAPPASHK
jgi:hypothetical protein